VIFIADDNLVAEQILRDGHVPGSQMRRCF
jgi:hypothetical protein